MHGLSSLSPPGHAPSTASAECPSSRSGGQGLAGRLGLCALLIANGLVDTQDQTAGLGSRLYGVDLDQGGLPDEALHHVGDALVDKVNASPRVALAVLHAQLVQNIGGVKPGVVAKLSRDDLQSPREALDDGLLLMGHVPVGEAVKRGRNLHLGGTATAHDGLVADGPLHDHDGVVQRALDFGNELLGTTAQDKGAGLGLGAVLEEVEALAADLSLVKATAHSEMLGQDVRASALDRGASRLDHALEVVGGHAAGAEDVAVGEELRGEIANGQLRQHNLGTCGMDRLELLEDDLPLCVHDGLVIRNLLDPNLGVILLRLQLELDVQADNLGFLEGLGLLLETGVRERLLESDTVDEERVSQGAARNLLDAYQLLVEVVLVEGEHGVDNHYSLRGQFRNHTCAVMHRGSLTLGEEGRVSLDQLAGHGSRR